MAEQFTCGLCGGTFDKAVDDEKALAEAEAIFGQELGADPSIVCDDCYERMSSEDPWLAQQRELHKLIN